VGPTDQLANTLMNLLEFPVRRSKNSKDIGVPLDGKTQVI